MENKEITYGHVKNIGTNKSQAFLAKSFPANTSKAATQETVKVPTPHVKKTKILTVLQSAVCHVSHRIQSLPGDK